MLIARYEVSYKITYLHNTIRFPYRGELKEKEKKHLGFLNIGLKLLFPWPIHRVIFHHPTPSTPMLITRYQTTSCWKPFAPVSRDSRELSLARRSPTPSTIRRGDKVFQPWPNTCLLTAPFVILGEKARRYPNAINTRLKERTGIHGKRPGEFLLAQGKRLCSPRRATPNLPWNSISRYKWRRSRFVKCKNLSSRRQIRFDAKEGFSRCASITERRHWADIIHLIPNLSPFQPRPNSTLQVACHSAQTRLESG